MPAVLCNCGTTAARSGRPHVRGQHNGRVDHVNKPVNKNLQFVPKKMEQLKKSIEIRDQTVVLCWRVPPSPVARGSHECPTSPASHGVRLHRSHSARASILEMPRKERANSRPRKTPALAEAVWPHRSQSLLRCESQALQANTTLTMTRTAASESVPPSRVKVHTGRSPPDSGLPTSEGRSKKGLTYVPSAAQESPVLLNSSNGGGEKEFSRAHSDLLAKLREHFTLLLLLVPLLKSLPQPKRNKIGLSTQSASVFFIDSQ